MSRLMPAHRLPVLAAAVAALGLSAFGIGVASPELLLRKGFDTSLAGASESTATIQTAAPIVGSEGFWLSHSESTAPTPWTKPVQIGDRITIANGQQSARVLEVIDIRDLGAGYAPVNVTPSAPRLQAVTCRDVTLTDAPPRFVRFIVEAGDVSPAPAAGEHPAPARAL